MAQPFSLPFLVFWTGTRCTLRCRDCVNLVPYLNPCSYDARHQIQALKALLQHCSIEKLQIQGGEPLTHPDIDFIIQAASRFPFQEIEIATNGTVPLSSRTIDIINMHKNISLRISNYPCAEHQRQKVINQCEQHNISFSVYNFMYANEEWFYSGGTKEEFNENEEHIQSMYETCDNNICHTLCNGVLYICGKVPAIHEIYKDTRMRPFESVDLINSDYNECARAVSRFFQFRPVASLACRYCLGTNQKVAAAIQIEKPTS